VCLVTPTYVATRSVTKRHVTWALRDKCKEFQNSPGREYCCRHWCNAVKLFRSLPGFFPLKIIRFPLSVLMNAVLSTWWWMQQVVFFAEVCYGLLDTRL